MIRILTAVIFIAISSLVKGQHLNLSAGVEKTALRCLYGGDLTFETKGKWGMGTFYQSSISKAPQESLSGNDTYYGVLLQVPLAKTDKIDFFATVRLGMANELFFVAVPGLETRIKTWKKLSTVFGMGYRIGYPAIGLKLSHPIF